MSALKGQPARKPKLLELDIVRAMAIIAVVLIHTTSEATVELPPGSPPQAVYLAVNKLCHFAVPLFILLSGLVLFYRYGDDFGPGETVRFYIRRVRGVLVPYLLWSLFYYFYNQWMFGPAPMHLDWSVFKDMLLWGEASYHLYFMVIIVQFYLLFPLLMGLCRISEGARRSLIWLGIAVQGAGYAYSHWIEPLDHMASLCINYFSMFTLGGWIGLHAAAFLSWLQRSSWVVPAAMLLGAAFAAMYTSERLLRLELDDALYYILMFVYSAFAACAFIYAARGLLERGGGAGRLLSHLGAASFGIYLLHPAVLTWLSTHLFLSGAGMGAYHVYTLITFWLTLTIPWFLTAAYGWGRGVLRRKPR